jgi:hypothetical protein
MERRAASVGCRRAEGLQLCRAGRVIPTACDLEIPLGGLLADHEQGYR